jgi:Na+/melibiose symporter-like transporter
MGKFLSWVFMIAAFLCWRYVILWYDGDANDGQIYVFLIAMNAIITTFLTTFLSPRELFYDVVRYGLLIVLALMGFFVGHDNGITAGWIAMGLSIAVIVFVTPSVSADIKGRDEGKQKARETAFAKAVLAESKRTNRHIDTMSENFDRRQRRKAAKKAAKEHEKEFSRRMFEWTAGWFWD